MRIREGRNIYVGQRKQYEIEAPGEDINPAYDSKEDGAVIEEEPVEDIEAKRAEEAEANKKEFEESKSKEADLKKAREAGKTSLRSP